MTEAVRHMQAAREVKRMQGKKIGAAMLAAAVAAMLGGCGEAVSMKPKKIYMGIACYNESDTFLSELISCVKTELENLEGASVTVTDAAGSQRTQEDQVQAMIDAGCNVLCVNLVDRADPSAIIDTAKENDVPIIFFNREPVAEDMMQWDKIYYVGADAKQSGIFQGELAAEAIKNNERIDRNNDGVIQYVILEGEPGHQDALIRTENAVETLKKHGVELEKVGHGIANWNRGQAANRMQQLIDQYQSRIELVLANNDDMALGAIDTYENMNVTEATVPVFFGIDGTLVGLEAVREGKLAGTVYNDKEGQAKAIVSLAESLVFGRETKDIEFIQGKYVYTPYKKVTKENVGEYLEE